MNPKTQTRLSLSRVRMRNILLTAGILSLLIGIYRIGIAAIPIRQSNQPGGCACRKRSYTGGPF